MELLREFLGSLQVGGVQVFDKLAIYPVLTSRDKEPFYKLLNEALKDKTLEVGEVDSYGRVGEILVKNIGDKPVLILDGEILTGAKQNRVVNVTLLVAAHCTLKIPVSCVEQGRWQYTTESFSDDVRFCYVRLRSDKSRQVAENVARTMTFVADQEAIWKEVSRKQRETGAHSKTGAVNKVYETLADKVQEYKKHFRPAPGQVGVIVFINGSFSCIDLFDSAETLHKLYTKMIESYALDAMEAKGTGKELPEKVEIQDLIGDIGDAQLKITPSVGLGQDVRIVGKGIVGSCLVYEDRVLHLAIFRTEEARDLNEDWQGAMIPPSRRRRF